MRHTLSRLIPRFRLSRTPVMFSMVLIVLSILFISFKFFVLDSISPKSAVVITTKKTYEATKQSLRISDIKKNNIIMIDSNFPTNESKLFSSSIVTVAGHIFDIMTISNSSFLLFGSTNIFKIPKKLYVLPKKNQVIGYTFAQCRVGNYALLLPDSLNGVMITKEAFTRFVNFNRDTLNGDYTDDEAFRIFTDLHSLRLLILPCSGNKPIPPWEQIDVIENDAGSFPKPWGTIDKIPEVWRITDLL